MVLAAGRGERMRPLSDEHPKPLLTVGGKPLLQWTIESLVRDGFNDLVVNTSWLGDQIQTWLGDGRQFDVHVNYSVEPDGPLGTGGGIHNALPLLVDQPFLVVNGDIWTDYSFKHLHEYRHTLAHLVLVDNPLQHPDGDFQLAQGLISNATTNRLTFAGIGVYSPRLFASCQPGDFPLAPLLRDAAENGSLGGEHYQGEWVDVGTPQRLNQLDQKLRDN